MGRASPPKRETVLHLLADAAAGLHDVYGVHALWLFGSVARGKARPDSDVDLLVELERPIDLFRLIELEGSLSSLMEWPVDLVERAALHPALKDYILAEAVRAA